MAVEPEGAPTFTITLIGGNAQIVPQVARVSKNAAVTWQLVTSLVANANAQARILFLDPTLVPLNPDKANETQLARGTAPTIGIYNYAVVVWASGSVAPNSLAAVLIVE